MTFYLKDPHSRVDYAVDWGAHYLDGQTIVGSGWAVEPEELGGVEIVEESYDLLRCAARIGGGIAGHVYSVSNQVALSDGTFDRRSIHLRVEGR
ncbi:MAG TPA: hypothetical protein VGB79_13790 [Allosphingosinicella sp.]|jgi:hypothetical protein